MEKLIIYDLECSHCIAFITELEPKIKGDENLCIRCGKYFKISSVKILNKVNHWNFSNE